MSIHSAALASAIASAAQNQVATGAAKAAAFGSSGLRFRCKRDANAAAVDPWSTGVEFINIGMTGPLVADPSTGVIPLGTLSGTTTRAAADLSTGISVWRIQDSTGTIYQQGTIGLTGSGCDLIMSASPAANSGFVINGATLLPFATLPLNGFVVALGATVTDVRFENSTGAPVSNQLVTFGQSFVKGAMTAGTAAVQLAGPSTVPAQMDVKATHPDGSVRHAVISAVIPSIAASSTATYNIVRVAKTTPAPAVPSDFAGLDSVVSITDGGVAYTASLATLLAGTYTTWLAGDVASEWIVKAPLVSAGAVTHPRIHARFAVRAFKGATRARVRVTIENTWVKPNAAATSGQSAWLDNSIGDVIYDVAITVGGVSVFTQSALKHFPYARWSRVFWLGTAPVVLPKQNVAYLIASNAVANYDQAITVSPTMIASAKATFQARSAPMQQGVAEQYMPNTGGRDDIAVLSGWDVRTLLSMDKDAMLVTLGQGELSGSWAAHYRDFSTDRPVSIADYPYMTRVGTHGDCYNSATQHYEDFPATVSNTNTNTMETAHCPDMNYLPYLLTGDYYFMEGLLFYAQYSAWSSNPGLRSAGQGLVHPDQTRGQAWSIRTLAHCAYILPDSHAQKATITAVLENNRGYYDANYTYSALPEMALGIMYKSAIVYPDDFSDVASGETLGIAPWQDDYMTSAVARAVELGFTTWSPFLNFKVKFSIARLTSGAAFCYVMASKNKIMVKAPAAAGGAFYTTMSQLYLNTIPAAMRAPTCGSQALCDYLNPIYVGRTMVPGQLITDGSNGFDGYASLMGPAVAAAATSGVANGANAWTVYSASPRASDLASHPQFAILPR